MSGTRSPFRTAPATDAALLVVHGSPSDDAPQQVAVAALADRVADRLPGWRVEGTTLATPGVLDAALDRLDGPRMGALIVPVFMADGWFTQTQLPERIAAAGHGGLAQLAPLGTLPAFHDLALDGALRGCAAGRLDPATVTVVLAAHGARKHPAPAAATHRAADHMRAAQRFRAVLPAFVEEPPFLADVLGDADAPAICLPYFALAAGHVTGDLTDAAETVRFTGPILPHLGAHPGLPALIAAELLDHARNRAPA